MRKVYLISDSMLSPLGLGSQLNFDAIIRGESGISEINNSLLSDNPIYSAVIAHAGHENGFTRFENFALTVANDAIGYLRLASEKTLFILSTTKGNISHLGQRGSNRLNLSESTKHIADKLGFKNHLTVSNACISGVMALLVAKRYISAGKYDHAVVVGAEELSKFIVSGFQSLYALSNLPCMPFDKDRTGISLGEAAGCIVLSAKPEEIGVKSEIELFGNGAITNDANHISGPSRTGIELAAAIKSALDSSNLAPLDISLVSAHGTATAYNDEMEAKAFNIAGISQAPTNSLKGYFGHTLGAAGLIETIITKLSLMRNELVATKGFSNLGVSKDVNVIAKTESKQLNFALKTASGFGGCNAALVLGKV